MKVLLDTNIVLDYLGANQGFSDDAEKLFELAEKDRILSWFRRQASRISSMCYAAPLKTETF